MDPLIRPTEAPLVGTWHQGKANLFEATVAWMRSPG